MPEDIVNYDFPDLHFFHSSSWSGQNASHALRILLDERHYDKRFRPEFEGQNAVVIQSLHGFYESTVSVGLLSLSGLF